MVTPETNLILILIIAMLNAYTAWRAGQTKSTLELLEKNTNSIKDELVAATAKLSHREGKDEGLEEARSEEPIKVEITKVPGGIRGTDGNKV